MSHFPSKFVALSFDVEEFDVPFENGVSLDVVPFERQIAVSSEGLERILGILERQKIRATFFCTAKYAIARPDMIKQIVEAEHEIASHSYHHSAFEEGDLKKSKEVLEQIAGVKVRGYRAPRMGSVSAIDLKKAGYKWDSSLNPCLLPGRYNNFSANRMPFVEACGLVELPASVSPILRLPLFWLALHNLPLWLYKCLCFRSLHKTGFLNIYTHPWEFSDSLTNPDFKIQYIIRRNSGAKLVTRYEKLVTILKQKECKFVTLSELANHYCPE